jgi:DNA-binding LytR/AlgR family response regulator
MRFPPPVRLYAPLLVLVFGLATTWLEYELNLANDLARSLKGVEAQAAVTGDRPTRWDPTEILHFYMDHGIVRARTSGDIVRVNYQLGDLERGLRVFKFFRAHRASLVNLRHVKEIRPTARSAFLLIMDDMEKTQIEISERQARTLRIMMPGL